MLSALVMGCIRAPTGTPLMTIRLYLDLLAAPLTGILYKHGQLQQ